MVILRKALLVLLFSAWFLASAFGSNTYFLPQAAVGYSGDLRFITQISIFNDGDEPADVIVGFVTNEGGSWTVNTSCTENPDLNGSNSGLFFTLPANKKYTISMTLSGGFQVGWVAMLSRNPLAVSATYGFYRRLAGTMGKIPSEPLWEAAVLPAPSAMRVKFAAHSRQGDTIYGVDVNTGFAIGNTNSTPIDVKADIWNDDGVFLGTALFSLPAWGHRAQFINELFSTLDLSDVRAIVQFTASGPIAVMAMKEAKRLDQVVYSTTAVTPSSDQEIGHDFDREPNNNIDQAQSISAPVQIYGTICHDDNDENIKYDHYAILLQAGQRIEIVLLAGSLGSPLDPSLTLRSTANALIKAAEEISTDTRDVKLSYIAGASGVYIIRVGDFYGTDSSAACYRMFVQLF